MSSKYLIRSERIEQVSMEVLSSLSREVILALAVLSSRLRSSLSLASLETGTEFFFCFLGGGCDVGTRVVAVTEGLFQRDLEVSLE